MDQQTAQRPDAADRPIRIKRIDQLRRLLFRRLPAEEAKEVRDGVKRDAVLSERYVLMCALSAGIATLGLLQSSTAVVIGAMLVSPLMSPIASLGFAFASVDGRGAERAAKVLGVGIAVGVVVGALLTWLSPIRNPTPEILARTAPTLLDLAVAVLSGLAGGYATVHRKGETAIGVAIATALMPPLATLGYSIATGRFDYAGGALLLFLTNLGAISFSFALVARIRGVARPMTRVDFKPIHVVAVVAAFLLLATPLALTLQRVAREAIATRAARAAIVEALQIESPQLAQLSVRWVGHGPDIAAMAIVERFNPEARGVIQKALVDKLHADVELDLQQIVAADPRAEAKAMIDAALAQMPANLQARAASTPAVQAPDAPTAAVLTATRIAQVAVWSQPSDRSIHILAAPARGLNLSEVRAEEERLNALGFGWRIEIVPAYVERITIPFGDDETELGQEQEALVQTAGWALERWAVRSALVEGFSGGNGGATARKTAQARAEAVAAALQHIDGLAVTARVAERTTASPLARELGAAHLRSADILPFGAR